MKGWLCIPAFLIALGSGRSPCKGDLMLNQWHLGSYVQQLHGEPFSAAAVFGVVQWPFHRSHSVTLGASSASGAYDFVRHDPDTATLQISVEHRCTNSMGEQPRCIEDTRFILSPTVDIFVSIDASYSYRLSGDPSEARFGASVGDVTDPDQGFEVFGGFRRAESFFGPLQGELTYSGEGRLTANRLYWIDYVVNLTVHSDRPSPIPATGSGEITINIRPIPEPATILLLLPATLILRRRLAH